SAVCARTAPASCPPGSPACRRRTARRSWPPPRRCTGCWTRAAEPAGSPSALVAGDPAAPDDLREAALHLRGERLVAAARERYTGSRAQSVVGQLFHISAQRSAFAVIV